MTWLPSKKYGIGLVTLFVLLLATTLTRLVLAQSPITFRDESTENSFPDALRFFISAASDEGDIQSAILFYRFGDSDNWTRQVVEVEPADEVALSYEWDTSAVTIVPSSPVNYYWQVNDTAGNRQRSEETLVYYDDIRYEWQILEDENIAVWWHDREQAFGQRVFDIAQRAFIEQEKLYGVAPEQQIRIIIYNDFDEFAEWHSFLNEFVGGQAFPSLGITTQIVTAYDSEEYWLNDVIPHEISHLYLYQASYHPLTNVPAWLNEGLAQYNEFNFNGHAVLLYTKERIMDGGLLPLWSLSGSFGNDEEDFRFAYDEAYSAVSYLIDTYGEEGIIRLLAAYRQGLSDDESFMEAFDMTLDEFELGWLEWQGVPLEMYPTRTPQPALVWPTAPPMAVTPSPVATVTSEPTATPSPSSIEPTSVAEAATTEPTAELTDTPAEVTPIVTADVDRSDSGGLPCLSGVLPAALLLMAAVAPLGRRRLSPFARHAQQRNGVDGAED